MIALYGHKDAVYSVGTVHHTHTYRLKLCQEDMAERGKPRLVEQEFTFRNVQLFKNDTLGTGSYGAVCKAKCDQLICAAKLLYPVLF